jgi:hypothetical protein
MDELEIEDYYLGKIVGGIKAWCEAAMSDAKEMSFSTPFSSKYVDFLQPKMEELSEKCNVKFYLEKELITTDLFSEIDMTGKWIYIIYKKGDVLETYLALKSEIKNLIQKHEYIGPIRKEIAKKLGRILGYSEAYIEERMHDGF